MRMNYRYCIDDVDAIVADHIQGQRRDADGAQQSVTPQEPPAGDHEYLEERALTVKPARRKR